MNQILVKNICLHHGGALSQAAKQYGGSPREWLDISTGINPNPYPVPQIPIKIWSSLPDIDLKNNLKQAAIDYFSVPQSCNLVIASGTQSIIQMLPAIITSSKVGILGFTYAEHYACWKKFNHQVSIVNSIEELTEFDIAVVVNPNNPDGRIIYPDQLNILANIMARHGGILIVDEAFGDIVPAISIINNLKLDNIIALRSFGKFFGLAGLRLGFAIGHSVLLKSLCNSLGPWNTSGPALMVAQKAFCDKIWINKTRKWLSKQRKHQQSCFEKTGLKFVGGTDLFLLMHHPKAKNIYDQLCAKKILVRKFEQHPRLLRIGICADNQAIQCVGNALNKAIQTSDNQDN